MSKEIVICKNKECQYYSFEKMCDPIDLTNCKVHEAYELKSGNCKEFIEGESWQLCIGSPIT